MELMAAGDPVAEKLFTPVQAYCVPPVAVNSNVLPSHAGPLLAAAGTGLAFTCTISGKETTLHCNEAALPISEADKRKL